ncbi:MBL fold metallo-hydrolase [Nitrococcus mobilis]|uniref:Hydroxyacylglutathione hydrolase n=1 Tax=Nitrococcus mobilis Nb-231 TaxID=314278 RepID=A4BPD1_9GAMM|nr:MBL fold metallo-hydrolase [Nitrococcus mobilis]EAR22432.1 hydroxyacylglutathione hydrolase [Nitrococcus mobilis Nb-231]
MSVYLGLIEQLDLKLIRAIDMHTHADHVTALGDLRDATDCATLRGEFTRAECVSQHVREGETVAVDGVWLKALYTPGHTNESFGFMLDGRGECEDAVFTSDVLLIRGSGRTDFQGGDPYASYDSIVNKLFTLREETRAYPAHDYKGCTVSTIWEERRFNPRLAGKSAEQYAEIMRSLNLPDPKMIGVAVPANLACGQRA